jgi:hypothetical protein
LTFHLRIALQARCILMTLFGSANPRHLQAHRKPSKIWHRLSSFMTSVTARSILSTPNLYRHLYRHLYRRRLLFPIILRLFFSTNSFTYSSTIFSSSPSRLSSFLLRLHKYLLRRTNECQKCWNQRWRRLCRVLLGRPCQERPKKKIHLDNIHIAIHFHISIAILPYSSPSLPQFLSPFVSPFFFQQVQPPTTLSFLDIPGAWPVSPQCEPDHGAPTNDAGMSLLTVVGGWAAVLSAGFLTTPQLLRSASSEKKTQLEQLLRCPTHLGHYRLVSGSDLLEHADVEDFMKVEEKYARWHSEHRLELNHIQIHFNLHHNFAVFLLASSAVSIATASLVIPYKAKAVGT